MTDWVFYGIAVYLSSRILLRFTWRVSHVKLTLPGRLLSPSSSFSLEVHVDSPFFCILPLFFFWFWILFTLFLTIRYFSLFFFFWPVTVPAPDLWKYRISKFKFYQAEIVTTQAEFWFTWLSCDPLPYKSEPFGWSGMYIVNLDFVTLDFVIPLKLMYFASFRMFSHDNVYIMLL